MRELYLRYLNRQDIEAAALADEEIIAAIEASLAMQERGETVIEPVVGDFVDNYQQDLPSELGLLCLFDPRTGAPTAGKRSVTHDR
jgi:ornithine cyclodeaminase